MLNFIPKKEASQKFSRLMRGFALTLSKNDAVFFIRLWSLYAILVQNAPISGAKHLINHQHIVLPLTMKAQRLALPL